MLCNDNGTVFPSTLWDTAKTVMRGKLIMWSCCKKKEKQINDLTTQLRSLESKHMECNEVEAFNQIQDTKQTLNNIFESLIEQRAKFIKQNFYKNGPKSKKQLA